MSNPIGLVIQAQAVKNRQALYGHLSRAQYTTVTVLNDFKMCLDIKTLLPNCIVVARFSDFEPAPGIGAVNHLMDKLNSLRNEFGIQAMNIAIMINCEQGFSPERCDMWADFIEEAELFYPGWSLVVGSPAAGTVKCGQSTEENQWLTWASRLLKVLAKYHGRHFLAVHEYTAFFPWLVSNGQWGDPAKPPSLIDWALDQWHLGRNVQGIMRACMKLGLVFPLLIISEGFFDDMQDVAGQYPGEKMGGWRTYADNFWKTHFKGIPAEELLTQFNIWIWEKVYGPIGFVVGAHFYTYQDASGRNEWVDDRVDNAQTYLDNMEVYHPGNIPIPNPPPKPDPISNPNPVPVPTTTTLRAHLSVVVPTEQATFVKEVLRGLRLVVEDTDNEPS